MDFIYKEVLHVQSDLQNIPSDTQIGIFKTPVTEDSFILEKDCDFLIGFYSEIECVIDLEIDDIVFSYVIQPGELFYAIDNKFILPYFALRDVYVKINTKLSLLTNIQTVKYKVHLVKYNVTYDFKKYFIDRLIYCKLNTHLYLIYDDGLCSIKNSLTLDRKTLYYVRLRNMNILKVELRDDSYTYLTHFSNNNDDTEVKPMNALQAFWKMIFS